MARPDIADLIKNSLGSGLPHPGKPETREPPRLIPLMAFRTAGMPQEMRQHIENTAQCIGEAIVHLIEAPAPIGADSVIINRSELDELRAAEDQPGDSLPVVCRICKHPIAYLRVISGRALVLPDTLRKVEHTCTFAETPSDQKQPVEATP